MSMTKKILSLFFVNYLGLFGAVAIYYPGGTVANTTITDDGTKQTIASGIEDCLNTAGWTTNSGHHALPTTLTSGTGSDGNVIKVIMSAATNTVQWKLSNVSGSVAPATTFGFLLPGTTGTWGCTANQFGFWVRSVAVGNLIPARSWVAVFVPNTAPLSTLAGEAPSALGLGLATSDTDAATTNQTWRATGSNATHFSGGNPAWVGIGWGTSDGSTTGFAPGFSVFTVGIAEASSTSSDYFSDNSSSVNFSDFLFFYSHNSANHNPYIQGWGYGMMVVNSNDCTLENKYSIDSHTFVCVTSTSFGGATNRDNRDSTKWGVLFLTCASGTSCSGS